MRPEFRELPLADEENQIGSEPQINDRDKSSFIMPNTPFRPEDRQANEDLALNERIASSLKKVALFFLCCAGVLIPTGISMIGQGAGVAMIAIGACCFGCCFAPYEAIGRSFAATARDQRQEIQRRGRDLERGANRVESQNNQVENAGLVNHLLESEFDHAQVASDALNMIHLDAQNIINCANCFYYEYDSSRDIGEALNNVKIDEDKKDELAKSIKYYSENLITIDYKQLGKIKHPEISQAAFYGLMVSMVKNPDKFSDLISLELATKLKEMPESEKDILSEKFDNHLTKLGAVLKNDRTGTLTIEKVKELIAESTASKDEQKSDEKGLDSNEIGIQLVSASQVNEKHQKDIESGNIRA